MTPVLKPRAKPGQTVTSTFRAPKALVDELDQAAATAGLSRNETVLQLLRYALDDHRRESTPPKPRR
jgi:metal-responsive CopG/Arc/MetJ family transcriptional regulator